MADGGGGAVILLAGGCRKQDPASFEKPRHRSPRDLPPRTIRVSSPGEPYQAVVIRQTSKLSKGRRNVNWLGFWSNRKLRLSRHKSHEAQDKSPIVKKLSSLLPPATSTLREFEEPLDSARAEAEAKPEPILESVERKLMAIDRAPHPVGTDPGIVATGAATVGTELAHVGTTPVHVEQESASVGFSLERVKTNQSHVKTGSAQIERDQSRAEIEPTAVDPQPQPTERCQSSSEPQSQGYERMRNSSACALGYAAIRPASDAGWADQGGVDQLKFESHPNSRKPDRPSWFKRAARKFYESLW